MLNNFPVLFVVGTVSVDEMQDGAMRDMGISERGSYFGDMFSVFLIGLFL
jgi:hypothetical protein